MTGFFGVLHAIVATEVCVGGLLYLALIISVIVLIGKVVKAIARARRRNTYWY